MAIYEYKLTRQTVGTILQAYEIQPNNVKVPRGFQVLSNSTLGGKSTEIDDLIDFDPSLETTPGPPPP